MLAHLADAVAREYTFERHVIDENMRTIPTHYHATPGRGASSTGTVCAAA